ncbi:putative intracellular septation protein A [Sinobacterium norvegicum]|uniref:Inner membrane-spanning protein YciB n=1 Tax=Sinobacterium norvegicum TaxID=1641715 RepID=A0ABN8EGI1_9GAMM|nr:inner membrane-spanning protein YciB [Sinobacterium norvegicum]CAH0990462.1 putative intracellular septation protein A [Sinobacterium norvegicum]
MKQIAELIPIILFFITYRMDGSQISVAGFDYTFDGIYSATTVLIIATIAEAVISRIITGKLEKRQLWMVLAVCVFGGLTLVLRNNAFIMWKPTIFNWGMAAVFIASQLISHKNLLERMLGSQLNLPKKVWTRLSNLWVANFIIVGALNLFVAYHYSEEFWVDYKLFSSIGFTVLLSIITVAVLAPHLKDETKENE